MKNIKKLLISLVLLLSATINAEEYLENGVLTPIYGSTTRVTNRDNTWNNNGWYIVEGKVSISSRIRVIGNEINLLLKNGATLTLEEGFEIWSRSKFKIYAQTDDESEMGSLEVKNRGIIVGLESSITINGGKINVKTSTSGASIGSDDRGSADTITINGGIIKANSRDGAGIGSGQEGRIKAIIINGGIIDAESGGGAGIGSGTYGEAETIAINGGIINAKSRYGAGIGSGNSGRVETIIISAGVQKITASKLNMSYSNECIGNGDRARNSAVVNFANSNGGIVTDAEKDALFYDSGEDEKRVIRSKTTSHRIDIGMEYKNRISADLEYAVTGETVTLTIDASINASSVRVRSSAGVVKITNTGTDQWTFTMPDGDVAVGSGHSHTLVHHEATATTIEYWQCSVCGKYFNDAKGENEITKEQTRILSYLKNGVLTKLTEKKTFVTLKTSEWKDGWYVVDDKVTISERIKVSGTVNLLLLNGAKLIASSGITVGSNASFNVYAQSEDEAEMGVLEARVLRTNDKNAGIGGESQSSSGSITFFGGKINAQGSHMGAAIGSGDGGSINAITINGGIVDATSNFGAGIGSGHSGSITTININGGIVNVSTAEGSGIGSGAQGNVETINLNGGIINVNNAKSSGAGIGSGYMAKSGTITINISDGITEILASRNEKYAVECIGKGYKAEGDVIVNFISNGNIVTTDEKRLNFFDSGEGLTRLVCTKLSNHWKGNGTESDPFIISDENDWNSLVAEINEDLTYAGRLVKLAADISVSKKLGDYTQEKVFSGTFEGNGHTVTVNITDTENLGTALFSYIKGATIKNLTVAGSITGGTHAAGLVGFSKGNNNKIENCIVTTTVNGGTHIGGILGHGTNSDVTIDNCIFKGLLEGGGTAKGVLFGWGDNGGTKSVLNSFYIEQEGQNTTALDLAKKSGGSVNMTDCYKTADAGTYGMYAYTDAASVPANTNRVEKTAVDGTKFYAVALPTGSGTENDPYIIKNEKDWNSFAYHVYAENVSIMNNTFSGKFVKLAADITVTQKIGDYTQGKPFSGTFDGNGHTVTANITDTENSGTALFGYISGATIKNLTVAGTITGGTHAAGLVGVSKNSKNKIENSIVTAKIVGETYIGGILGHSTNSTVTIDNCVFKGTLEGSETTKGVFIGWGNNGGNKNVLNSFYIQQKSQNTTALDLAKMDAGSVSMTDCYKTADIGTYGVYAYADAASVPANTNRVEKTAVDGTTFYVVALPTGSGTEADPYIIENEKDWNSFAYHVHAEDLVSVNNSFAGKFIKLTADISVTKKIGDYTQGKPFSGTFDGNGHTITANITDTENSGTALFSYISEATIKNLTVAGKITGGLYAAGLVGSSNGKNNKIENSVVTAKIIGNTHIGGILGYGTNSDVTINNCVFKGLLEGGETAGVFMGWTDNSGTQNVTNSLYIQQSGQNTNGLDLVKTGDDQGNVIIIECYKTADVGSYGAHAYLEGSSLPVVLNLVERTAVDGTKFYFIGLLPTGSGSIDDPYIIRNTDDWNTFAIAVNDGNTFKHKFIKLDADISVTKKIGDLDKGLAFSGTFDGNKHTITANITDTDHTGTALFHYINGATIQKLTVAGTINGGIHSAGLVGVSLGTGNKITHSVVSATINGGTHIGGILGHGRNSDIVIENCVFKGKLVGGGTAKGVFFGWGDDGGTKQVTDCLYIQQSDQNTSNLDLAKMHAGKVNMKDCYKTADVGSYGMRAYLKSPATSASQGVSKMTACDGTVFYIYHSITNDFALDDDGYYLTTPLTGTKKVTIPSGMTSFKVYDDGGKNGNYSNSTSGARYLIMTAPEGYILWVTGRVATYNSSDYLYIRNGSSSAKSLNSSIIYERNDIDYHSTGNIMTITFYTNQSDNAEGFDLTVNVVKNVEHSITCNNADIGGNVVCDKSTAKTDENVALTVTPPTGYLFYGYKVVGDGYEKTIFDGWYSEKKTISIKMPILDVSVTPLFTKAHSAEEGLYVNMLASSTENVVIPSGVTSFNVYDDGGKDNNCSKNGNTQYLVMTAPEGHIIQVTGKTQVNSYDNLRIYDGGRDGTVLALKNGSVSNINYLSSGNTMTLRFYSSTSYQKKGYVYEGLNLKVTVLSGTYSITCNSDVAGGSASCDKQTAKADEEITLTATPPTGYVFYGYKVTGDGYEKTVNFNGLYTETKSVTIERPLMDVTVTPLFTNNLTVDGGLYLKLPLLDTIEVTIPSGVQSFKVYDNGGKDGNYTVYGNGAITMKAPEGYILWLTGDANTYFASSDYLRVRDGDIKGTILTSSNMYGDDRISGVRNDVDLHSSSNMMTLDFRADYSASRSGFDFTVNVAKADIDYAVTCNQAQTGGISYCDKSKAKFNESVSMTVTPSKGYLYYGYKIIGSGFEKTVLDEWSSETKTVSIERHPTDVTVTPLFTAAHTADEELYVTMPIAGTKYVTIPPGVTSFKVYDDGGKDGNYNLFARGYLTMTAPEGYILQVTGRAKTPSSWIYLRIYDGSTNSSIASPYIYRNRYDIDYHTSGNVMSMNFHSGSASTPVSGLDLTVNVVKADIENSITCNDGSTGGTASCDKSKAKVDENVTLTVTPSTGYLFYGYEVAGTNYKKTVFAGWHSEKTSVLIANERPLMDISITPLFTDAHSAEDGLYLNIPTAGAKYVTIPSEVKSFKVYDDGGKDGNYSDSAEGVLNMTAPEGYILRVTGRVATYNSSDGFYFHRKIGEGALNLRTSISDVYLDYGIGDIYGLRDDIDMHSTGNTMAIRFFSNNTDNDEGLDLTVSIVKDNEYAITCQNSDVGGTASCNKAQAKVNDEVSLTATPPKGYLFYGYKVVGSGYEKTIFEGWSSETKTVAIERPPMDVTVTPLFTKAHTAEEGLYVNMPIRGTKDITIPSDVKSFKVYDEGGKDGNYSNNPYTRNLVMTAPDGYMLWVTGRAVTYNSSDYLYIRNGGTNATSLNSPSINGTRDDIDYHSTGNRMTVNFYSNNVDNEEGFDLTVVPVKRDSKFSITCKTADIGGSASCDKSKATFEENVSLTVTPPTGYLFSGYKVTGTGYEKTVFEGWHSETKTVTVERPPMDITVTPLFTKAHTAKEGLYVNMPITGTRNVSIPSDVKSFKVYDEGGKDGNYINRASSRYLVMTAPEGYILEVSGRAVTFNSSDYIRIRDGGTSASMLNKSDIYGTQDDIYYHSTGNTMTIYFYSNSVDNEEGLDLTINIVKTGIVTIIGAEGNKTAFIDGNYQKSDALQIDEAITVDNVMFNREFPANTYSTIVLPFSVNTANVEGLNAVLYYNGIGKDKKGNDAIVMKVIWATNKWVEDRDIKNDEGTCCKVYDNTNLTANTPYLVQMGDASFKIKGPVTIVPTTEAITEKEGWKFRGMWEFKRWDEGDRELGYVYGFAASTSSNKNVKVGDFVKIAKGAYIPPLRAYLVSSNIPETRAQLARANGAYVTRPSVTPEKVPEFMSVIVENSDGKQTTVIGQYNTRTGEFKMNNNHAKFDSKGRRVNSEKPNAHGAYYKKKVSK